MTTTDHFTSVNTMIQALRSDDPEERLGSMRGLHLIAATLGPERVRDELLPFLTDYLDENDEVLREFAKGLGSMLREVGGISYVQHLLTPLELLCGLDDVSVRDEAVTSMTAVGQEVFKTGTPAQKQEFTTIVQNMAKNESPQARCAAAALLSVPYAHVSMQQKSQLRQSFQKLCSDDEIMVRRAAVVALGTRFAKVLEAQCSEMQGVFTTLCKDPSDGVRLQCVATSVSLLEFLQDKSSIVQSIKALSTDSSWRVRYMVADKLYTVACNFSSDDLNKVAFPIFKSLCGDKEAEIRAAAVLNMNEILALSNDANSKKDIVAAGTKLVSDTISHVRMYLATTLLKCVSSIQNDVWQNSIAPVCTKLLQDTDADVRLALVGGFSALEGTPEGKEVAPKLVPVIISLANDPKWRVRETVVQQLPSLIGNLGTNSKEVLDLCLTALNDQVATIREAACQACAQLVSVSGAQWAKAQLFPLVLPLSERQSKDSLPDSETEPSPHSYLRRVTFCHLLRALIPVIDAATFSSTFASALQQLSLDCTANVRINVARLLVLVRKADKSSRELDAILNKLSNDCDRDVKDVISMNA